MLPIREVPVRSYPVLEDTCSSTRIQVMKASVFAFGFWISRRIVPGWMLVSILVAVACRFIRSQSDVFVFSTKDLSRLRIPHMPCK